MKSSVLVLTLAVFLLGGCVRVDVGDHKPTLGEELKSLARAREQGVISEDEFAYAKRLLFDAIMP